MCPESIVWADLRFNRTTPSNRRLIPGGWRVEKVETPDYVSNVTARESPGLLVFEFDRPDLPSLSSLSSIRRRFAAIPVLMLTEYHSEALAIWALRNRVAEYLVLPVTEAELVNSLKTILANQWEMMTHPTVIPIPRELRFRRASFQKTAAALTYVETHYTQAVREETVAALCNMGVSTFSRVFKQEQGRTFREYLLGFRIVQARSLLHTTDMSVTDVAFTVGFNDLAHFSRTFKRLTELTPSSFQNATIKQSADGKNLLLIERKIQNTFR